MNSEPIFNIPRVILIFVFGFILCHIFLISISLDDAENFIIDFGFIPAGFIDYFRSGLITSFFDQHSSFIGDLETANGHEIDENYIEQSKLALVSLVTYSFIHAGWTHLLINTVSFVAFGSIVARRIGSIRFILLFCISAIGGSFTHLAFHFHDITPIIGASAAVSGLIAASIRFMFQPGESFSAFPMGDFSQYKAPSLTILKTIQEHRSLSFICLWFGTNIITGVINTPFFVGENSIAWESHLGGFIVGLVSFSFLDRPIAH